MASADRNMRISSGWMVLVLLSGGLTAGGCVSPGGVRGDGDTSVRKPASGRLGSGLTSLMSRDDSEQADTKPAKRGKGKKPKEKTPPGRPWSDDPPPGLERAKGGPRAVPPGRAKNGAPSSGDSAPQTWEDRTERGGEYETAHGSWETEHESRRGSAGIDCCERTDFAFLVRGGGFTEDLGETSSGVGTVDFAAGEFWGLEASILVRNEFGPEGAFGISYERLETASRPDVLSEGSLVMNPLMLKAEFSTVFPGCRRLRFALGAGLGLSFAKHELSKGAQADCAALGYECSERVGTGFGGEAHIGPRYRIAPWLEGQAMFSMVGFGHNVGFKTVDLVTGEVRRARSRANFQWAYGSLGLRFIF